MNIFRKYRNKAGFSRKLVSQIAAETGVSISMDTIKRLETEDEPDYIKRLRELSIIYRNKITGELASLDYMITGMGDPYVDHELSEPNA